MISRKSLSEDGNPLLEWKLKNSEAMNNLMHGSATKHDMSVLVTISNVAEALHDGGVGAEYSAVAAEGEAALVRIAQRSAVTGRYTPSGADILALQLLIELHDAQTELLSVKEWDQACYYIQEQIASGKTRKLPLLKRSAS